MPGGAGGAGGAGASGAAGGAGGAGAGANPFMGMGMNPMMMGGMGGMSPAQMQAMMGGAGGAAASTDTRPPKEKYAEQIAQIKEMGFNDEDAIAQILE